MNIINTKDVPTRLASPYSAKYRHRRPYPYPRTEASIGAHPIKVLTHLEWKTAGQCCPDLGNSCSYTVSKLLFFNQPCTMVVTNQVALCKVDKSFILPVYKLIDLVGG